MKATIRKATPAQNQLPVRNQTTTAIMTAGRKKRSILAITMIMMTPMSRRSSSAITSKRNPKLGRGKGGVKGKNLNKTTFLTTD